MTDSPRASARLRVAVVLPTLDEAPALPGLLPALAAAGADEIVVSDGGSTDGTRELAARLGATVVAGEPCRGAQLNRGARATRADILLFLHADTILPAGALERVRQAIAGGAVGGSFLVRFDQPGVIYSLGARVANLRARLTRVSLGDHAQFVSRSHFDAVGGFPDWPILEDLDFARRLRDRGRIALLAPPVLTSARRFEKHGPLRTVLNNWWIFLRFLLGASAESLAARYRPQREVEPARRPAAQTPARSSTCTVKPS